MPSTVVAYPGALSAAGLAKEPTYGTLTAATSFAPVDSLTLDPDPGIFYPEVMTGLRDLNIYALQGMIKIGGQLGGPAYPSSFGNIIVGAFGSDAGQTGAVIGAAKAGTATSPSGSSVTYTVSSGGAPVAGEFYQFGGTPGTPAANNEVRKITLVSGVGPYTLTLDSALTYTHTGSTTITQVKVPTSAGGAVVHTLAYSNTLPSYTIEKNTGGHESIQYTGSRVNKLHVKAVAANEAVTYQADYLSQGFTVLPTPTSITVDQSSPWVFAEAQLTTLFGDTNVINIQSVEANVDNGLKDIWTLNSTHLLQFLVPTSFKASGTLAAVWTSFDDVDWGYFNKAVNATQGALTVAFTHTSTGEALNLSFPQINLTKYKDNLKHKDVVITNLDWEASYQFSSSSRMTASITSTVYTSF